MRSTTCPLLTLLALSLLVSPGCRGKKTFDPPTKETPLVKLDPSYEVDPALFTDSVNGYALGLMQNQDIGGSEETYVVSPPNLYIQSLMLLNASSGETYNGIAESMQFNFPDHSPLNDSANAWLNQAKETPNLNFGNAMFMVWPFKLETSFASRMARTLDSDIIKLGAAGIAAQQGIDDWTKQRTFGNLTGLNQPLSQEDDMMVGLMTAGIKAKIDGAKTPKSATSEDWAITAYPLNPVPFQLITFKGPTPFPDQETLTTLLGSLEDDPNAPAAPSLTPAPLTHDFTNVFRSSGMTEITDGPLDLRYMALELNGKFKVSQNLQTVELEIQGTQEPQEKTRFLIRNQETGLILFFGQL